MGARKMMTFNEYQQEAIKTVQPTADAVYLAGKLTCEAAEIFEPILKWRYHGKTLNRDEILEEIGDLTWYCAVLADKLGASFDDVLSDNIAKLRQRHGEQYNAAHYQKQDDLPVVRGYDFVKVKSDGA